MVSTIKRQEQRKRARARNNSSQTKKTAIKKERSVKGSSSSPTIIATNGTNPNHRSNNHRGNKTRQRLRQRPAPKKNTAPTNTTIVRRLTHSIQLSRNSIHDGWKREALGGLIRWYVNLPQHQNQNQGQHDGDRQQQALKTIEDLYRTHRCNVQATKHALLELMLRDASDGSIPPILAVAELDDRRWIDLRMIVENPFPYLIQDAPVGNDTTVTIENVAYETIRRGKGVVLQTAQQPGEGPAHAHETWMVVIVPSWAMGRVYYLDVRNRSTLDLSCAVTIDGHEAAHNAPLPAQDHRTIQPSNHRYFETHQWRLAPSRMIGLQQHAAALLQQKQQQQQQQRNGQEIPPGNPPLTTTAASTSATSSRTSLVRYNQRRPNYHGQRVSLVDFPDPSSYGWTFTGSKEESKVEFFEKRLNNGSICRMDFYYTTATVKTVLHHPNHQLPTQLFRRCLQGEPPGTFQEILKNPRYHSNVGYYQRANHPSRQFAQQSDDHDEDMNEVDNTNNNNSMETTTNSTMAVEDTAEPPPPPETTATPHYFAKNDNYVFEEAGHENRTRAMAQLQPTMEFQAWEQANRTDWACIHARCFVSLRRYMHTGAATSTVKKEENGRGQKANKGRGGGGRRRQDDQRRHLPEMTPVVQVQAAQGAVVSTQYVSTGTNTANATSSTRRSRVKMERIKGLNDSDVPGRGTDPVFNLKLYYRAEDVLKPASKDHTSSDEDENEDTMKDEDEEGEPATPADQLRDAMPLDDDYKQDKIDQLHRWYQTCKARDKNEADARVVQAQHGIQSATTPLEVDEHLKAYWDWHLQQEWATTTPP